MAIPKINLRGDAPWMAEAADPISAYTQGAETGMKMADVRTSLAAQAQRMRHDAEMFPLEMRAKEAQTNLTQQRTVAGQLANELSMATFQNRVNLSGMELAQASEDLQHDRAMNPLRLRQQDIANRDREIQLRTNNLLLQRTQREQQFALGEIERNEESADMVAAEMARIKALIDSGKFEATFWDTYTPPAGLTKGDVDELKGFTEILKQRKDKQDLDKNRLYAQTRNIEIAKNNSKKIINLSTEFVHAFSRIGDGPLNGEQLEALARAEETSEIFKKLKEGGVGQVSALKSMPNAMEYVPGLDVPVLSSEGKTDAEVMLRINEERKQASEERLKITELNYDLFAKVYNDVYDPDYDNEAAAAEAGLKALGYMRTKVITSATDIGLLDGPTATYDMRTNQFGMMYPPDSGNEDRATPAQSLEIPEGTPTEVSELIKGHDLPVKIATELVNYVRNKGEEPENLSPSDLIDKGVEYGLKDIQAFQDDIGSAIGITGVALTSEGRRLSRISQAKIIRSIEEVLNEGGGIAELKERILLGTKKVKGGADVPVLNWTPAMFDKVKNLVEKNREYTDWVNILRGR